MTAPVVTEDQVAAAYKAEVEAARAAVQTFAVFAIADVVDAAAPLLSAGLSSVILAGLTASFIGDQVRAADKYVSDVLSVATGLPVPAAGLDPDRYHVPERLEAAFETAISKATPTPDGGFDLTAMKTSITRIMVNETMTSGKRATSDAYVTASSYFAQSAAQSRAATVARGGTLRRRVGGAEAARAVRLLGHVRVTSANPCDLCRSLAADGVIPISQPIAAAHPSCACISKPIIERTAA